jgi:hypothetical protein
MSSRDIAFLLALAAGSVLMWRLQGWCRRQMHRAPVGLQFAIAAASLVSFVLGAANLVPLTTSLTFVAGLSLVALVWGWVRYHRSPNLRRWEAAWQQIETHLDTDDQDAADKVMMTAFTKDDEEREQLRAAAPHDRRAALAFQHRTEAELKAVSRSAARFARIERTFSPGASAGAVVISTRRQRLEADVEWIRTLLSGASGAA